MSKPDKSKKSKDPLNEPKEEGVTSQSLLKSFLKINKDDHYNFEEAITYKVSSGSLLLDYVLGGGLCPGLHRFCGIFESGKSSSSLQFMKNFLDSQKNGKGIYIKAEGRLSQEMIERSGVKFVFDEDKWVEGTCYVFESNIYETVVELMRQLVGNNPEKLKYFFLLDSVDGLIRKGDLDKNFEDSAKVAGGAVIAADFMKRVSISLQKRGHIAVFISQVRADIKLDPYSKAPVRQTTATGGNALLHFANWIFEFDPKYNSDLILQDPNAKYDEQKNPYLGHTVKITIKKSPNEKTNTVVRYPIKYGRKNGTSNWVEKEILEYLLACGYAMRNKAWITFKEEFLETLKEAGFVDFPIQVQGSSKFEALIVENEKLKKFLYNYILSMINITTSAAEVE
jgi:RecA/RadA recombinase